MKKNWKNFKERELTCRHCGRFNPNPEFQQLMDDVQRLRERVGFPMIISSAYRCEDHPIERRKIEAGGKAGYHSVAAVDLKVDRGRAYEVLRTALDMGFTGIGVNQKGGGRFIHLDQRAAATVWSY